MPNEKALLSREKARRLWEELKAVQKPKFRPTHEEIERIKAEDHREDSQLVSIAFEELRATLANRSTLPGSFCMFLHSQLQPSHTSTHIERTATGQHPSVLVESSPGIEYWLWGTSDSRRPRLNLRRVCTDPGEHVAKIERGSSREVNFNHVRDQMKSCSTSEHFETIVNQSYRSFPERDTYLGAHWKLLQFRRVRQGEHNLDRYIGPIPSPKLNELLVKLGKSREALRNGRPVLH